MNKHTPTPWHVASGNQIRSERDQIAKTWLMRGDEGQANAAHIVRCVNSHEALVKALKDLIGAINLDHPDAHEAVAFAEAYARAALAAAGAPQ